MLETQHFVKNMEDKPVADVTKESFPKIKTPVLSAVVMLMKMSTYYLQHHGISRAVCSRKVFTNIQAFRKHTFFINILHQHWNSRLVDINKITRLSLDITFVF